MPEVMLARFRLVTIVTVKWAASDAPEWLRMNKQGLMIPGWLKREARSMGAMSRIEGAFFWPSIWIKFRFRSIESAEEFVTWAKMRYC